MLLMTTKAFYSSLGGESKVEDQGKEAKRAKEDQIIPRCVNFVDQICNNYKTKQDIKKYILKNNQQQQQKQR